MRIAAPSFSLLFVLLHPQNPNRIKAAVPHGRQQGGHENAPASTAVAAPIDAGCSDRRALLVRRALQLWQTHPYWERAELARCADRRSGIDAPVFDVRAATKRSRIRVRCSFGTSASVARDVQTALQSLGVELEAYQSNQ